MAAKKRKFEQIILGFLDDHLPYPKRRRIDLLVVVDGWMAFGDGGHKMDDNVVDVSGSLSLEDRVSDALNLPDLDFELPEEIGSFELVGNLEECPEIGVLPCLFEYEDIFVCTSCLCFVSYEEADESGHCKTCIKECVAKCSEKMQY